MLAVGQLKLVTCFDPCVYLQQCDSSTDDTIYKYKAKTLNGSYTVNFSDYTGKTVLFVNVATYWGLTYQYVGKKLHHRHRDTVEINKSLCKTFNCWSFFFFRSSELNALHEEMKHLGLTILPALKWEVFIFRYKSVSGHTTYIASLKRNPLKVPHVIEIRKKKPERGR